MPDSLDNSLALQQAQFNRSTRDHWKHFSPHREQITALLFPAFDSVAGTLCVLGAGNCNDLDLRKLVKGFERLHLVDLDANALGGATRRQGVEGSARIVLHPQFDLTGVATALSSWSKARPGPTEVDAAIHLARAAAIAPLPGPFDVVHSSCLLSQLCGYADDMLGRDHPRAPELRRAIRDRHLRLMVDLLAPGGTGLLICDMVSSGTVHDLPGLHADDLPSLVNKLAHSGDHFAGLSPASILGVLKTDPIIAPLVADAQLLRPWRWTLGPLKSFLVYGVRVRRCREAVVLNAGPSANRLIVP